MGGKRHGYYISIHALHEESDSGLFQIVTPRSFQSTLSMRRATILFISQFVPIEISIHALHEESDADKIITTKTQI